MTPAPPSDILVLSPTPTHPHDFGNRKRLYQVCSGLKQRGARISFILYPLEMDWRARCPADVLDQMRQAWDEVHIVPPSIPVHVGARGEDHGIDEWWDPAVETFLNWYLQARRFDAMVVNYTYLSRALTLRPRGCLGILDTHDKFSGRRQLLASIGIGREFFHTTEHDEATGLSRADLVLAIKEQEQTAFEAMTGSRVMTLPFCEPRRWIEPQTPDPDGYLRVGILGARNNLNFYNVRRFLEQAVPLVRSHIAPVRFVLAGSMCSDIGPLYRHEPCVEVMGTVAEVDDFYTAVDVVAVPMDVSSGQKIKIGEALGFGMPLISHAHAFEGYPPSHRLHACTSFQQMAEAIVDLSFNREAVGDLGVACRRSWLLQSKRSEEALDAVIDQVETFRPRELIVIDAERLANDPFLQAHVLSMGHLVSSFARLTFLLQGDVGPQLLKFLLGCRPWAQVLGTGEIAREAALEGVLGTQGADQALLEQTFSRVWLYDRCETAEIARQQLPVVAVRHLSRGAGPAVWPVGHVNSDGLDIAVGTIRIAGGQAAFEIEDMFTSAVVDGMRSRDLATQQLANGRPSIWILASRANEALARAFAHVLLKEREQRQLVLIGTFGPDEKLASAGAKMRLCQGTAFDPEITRSRPDFVIDLTERQDPARLYACLFEGTQVPVWRPGSIGVTSASSPGAVACSLPRLIASFDHLRRDSKAAVEGLVRTRLDLSGLYNRFVTAYAHMT